MVFLKKKHLLVFVCLIATISVSVLLHQKTQIVIEPPETITVSLSNTYEESMQSGFLNGVNGSLQTTKNAAIIETLKPESWRISDWAMYERVSPYNPKITFVLSDAYTEEQGGWEHVRPADHWDEWSDFVGRMVQKSINENKPIAYWDVWGEPDTRGGTPWMSSYDNLLVLYKVTVETIHRIDPHAKIIGPSTSGYDPEYKADTVLVKGLDIFVHDLYSRYGVVLDAIAWHELGTNPEDLATHVETLRKSLGIDMPGYHPEFHINEYGSEVEQVLPGWSVGWLYYLEQAHIDSINRACWNIHRKFSKEWSSCWDGLNGLFEKDFMAPLSNYFVYKWYADLSKIRITVATENQRTVALASTNGDEGIKMIVGRLHVRDGNGEKKDVTVIVTGFKKAKKIKVSKTTISTERGGPTQENEEVIDVIDGGAKLVLPSFYDGDAMLVKIAPVS